MADRVLQRRDTAANWAAANPILMEGEIGIVTDGAKGYKIGDGVTRWNALEYPANPTSVVQELGDSEVAVMSQKAVQDEVYRKFLSNKSISGYVTIDYNHIVSIVSTQITYKSSPDYDTAWVVIQPGTTVLAIEGATSSYVTLFSSNYPLNSDYITAQSMPNYVSIPNNCRLAVFNLPKTSNPNGYNNLRVYQDGSFISLNQSYINPFTIKGFCIRQSGILDKAASEDVYATDFLRIQENSPIIVVGHRLESSQLTPVAFYNSNKEFISAYDGPEISNHKFYFGISDIPQGAYYIRCTGTNIYNNILLGVNFLYKEKEDNNSPQIDTITLPKGKNYLNPEDNLLGYGVTNNAGVVTIISMTYGIMSNKLYLDNDVYVLDNITPSTTKNVYLVHFDNNDDVIGYNIFTVQNAQDIVLPYNYSYSRLSLKNTPTAAYDPAQAQFEKGIKATSFESYQGSEIISLQKKTGYRPNMMLFGNSTAFSGNIWFLRACSMLGVKGYNYAKSGELIYTFATNYRNRDAEHPYGTVWTKEEFNDFDVLVLCYSASLPIHLEDKLKDKVEDYASVTFSALHGHYSDSWDYVLKQYTKDCYDARLDPESKWYNTQEGKPCKVIVCTWACDSRTAYNKSVRILQKKWGFYLMEFDSNTGFSSRVPMEELIQPTNGMASYMKGVLNSEFSTNPSEPQNNVINMWHQNRLPGSPIQYQMSQQFYSFVKRGMYSVYERVNTQAINGQFYTKDGYALLTSNGLESVASEYSVTDYIPLDKNQDLIVDVAVQYNNDTYAPVAFYDKNKTYLGCIHNLYTDHTTSSNALWANYIVSRDKFNTGGEFANAVYFRCTDNKYRKGEIQNPSIEYLLSKLIAVCNHLNINIADL